ncbi:hypothetical protein [Aeromicrobium sp.]|nr:hypothetical protein [Aeromicrobium sp.]
MGRLGRALAVPTRCTMPLALMFDLDLVVTGDDCVTAGAAP